jgi:hypothetical protein
MKKLIFIILLTIPFQLSAPPNKCVMIAKEEGINPYENLWKAVCQVETGGNAMAYNSHEGAVGIAQIRLIRLRHYNRLTGKNYTLREMYDTLKAKEVFMYFCNGRDFETIAREWNGKGRMTVEYWKKVKVLL